MVILQNQLEDNHLYTSLAGGGGGGGGRLTRAERKSECSGTV